MIDYVVGLAFNDLETSVLLIEKNRPDWQSGYLNGIGGKIENGESAVESMIREFKEETGLDIDKWEEIATVTGYDNHVTFFKAVDNSIYQARSMTDEEVVLINCDEELYECNLIYNLKWLIPLSLDNETIKPINFNQGQKNEKIN